MRTVPLASLLVLSLLLVAAYPDYRASGKYTNEFLREPNYTINYSKLPLGLRIVTWTTKLAAQHAFDRVVSANGTTLRPSSCPGGVALCYAVINHSWSDTLPVGRNRTSLSTYVLPETRVRLFVCLGEDTACVAQATSCACPVAVPRQQQVRNYTRSCADVRHLCTVPGSGATMQCEGSHASCIAQYGTCGCGRYGMCTAKAFHTCINEQRELFACKGEFAQCVDRYVACWCGDQMLALQEGCAQRRHLCVEGGKNVTCAGTFAQCATRYDTCRCGVDFTAH